MIGLLAVYLFIGLQVVAVMVAGRVKYGSLRRWWDKGLEE